MSRYDGLTGADLHREYAKSLRELAAQRPDIEVSCRESAEQWELMAQRADEAEAAAR